MTLPALPNFVTYTGNGSATVFPYTFRVDDATTLVVTIITIESQTEVVADPSSYSVSGLGNPSGGSVTYPLIGSPLAATHRIKLERILPIEQQYDISNQSGFLPETLEAQLDRMVMMLQQLDNKVDEVTGGGGAAIGDVMGPVSSTDNAFALFSGTFGKTIKQATQSGIPVMAVGVLSSTKTVPAGDLVGTTDVQTMTNKTLPAPIITGAASFDNTSLRIKDPLGANFLTIKPNENLGNNLDLNILMGGGSRTLSLQGNFTVSGNSTINGTAYVVGGTDVALADGGTGRSLTSPGSDQIFFWDQSALQFEFLQLGTNLSIAGTVLNATLGTGAGTGDVVGPASSVDNNIVTFNGITGKLIKDSTIAISSLVSTSGFTMTGKINTVASASGGAGLNLPHGADPSAPVNGDLWTKTGGLFARINSTTVQFSIVGHTHSQSDITNLTTDLAAKAPLSGPTFTGKVTFLASASGGAGANYPHGAAPSAPVNGDFWTTTAGVFWRINGTTQTVAFLDSPAFTGTPTAPTATPGTNTTQIATTAFVAAATGGGSAQSYLLRSVGGTAAAITANTGFSLGALAQHMMFKFKPTNNSTGATTIEIDGLAAVPLRSPTGAALAADDIHTGRYYDAVAIGSPVTEIDICDF